MNHTIAGNIAYSQRNNEIHATIVWLKPQMQAVYAKWEQGDLEAYEQWNALMDEENATQAMVNRCNSHVPLS